MSIHSTRALLDTIKEMLEEDFTPNGGYYVDKLENDGKTSLVLHMLYDTPEQDKEDSEE